MSIRPLNIVADTFTKKFVQSSIETGSTYDNNLQRIKEISSVLANTIDPRYSTVVSSEKVIPMLREKKRGIAGPLFSLANQILQPLNEVITQTSGPGIKLPNNQYFEDFFSDKKYGDGFASGLSSIFATIIILGQQGEDKEIGSSDVVNEYAAKVFDLSQAFFTRFSSPNEKGNDFAKLRKKIIDLNTYGSCYKPTFLDFEKSKKTLNEKLTAQCDLKVDPTSGNLVAEFSCEFSKLLFNQYKSQIEECLTEEGKKQLCQTYPIGRSASVIIAHSDELTKVSPADLDRVIESNKKQITLNFEKPQIKLGHEDYRYLLVASIIADSEGVDKVRKELDLKDDGSFERPLHYVFGAVRNGNYNYKDNEIIAMMQDTRGLDEWKEKMNLT